MIDGIKQAMERFEEAEIDKPEWQRAIDAGYAAMKAGVKKNACPLTSFQNYWYQGWNQAVSERNAAFEQYLKERKLFEAKHLPPHWPRERMEAVQNGRQKRMDALVKAWPELPAGYDKFMKDRGA